MYVRVDEPDFWEEKYKNNQTGWDIKGVNPVFTELLDSNELLMSGKILIAGCGKGYDAVFAAEKGYEVTAIDFSSTAINHAIQLAAENKVRVNFLNEDIFTLNNDYKEYFDVVYEYTTYCSINPLRRKEFAEKISSLLKKGGKLISILFPVDKRTGGPPFSVDVREFYRNFSEHLKLEYSSRRINSIKPRTGREVLQIYYRTPDINFLKH